MVLKVLLLIACLAAALAPLSVSKGTVKVSTPFVAPPGLDLREFTEVELLEQEKTFAGSFPGTTKRFEKSDQHLIVRYVLEPTRKVHSAETCFRAWGYKLVWRSKRSGKDGGSSCFEAERERKKYLVCEEVISSDGASFPDVSAWYYQAILGHSKGPWWTLLEVRRI